MHVLFADICLLYLSMHISVDCAALLLLAGIHEVCVDQGWDEVPIVLDSIMKEVFFC